MRFTTDIQLPDIPPDTPYSLCKRVGRNIAGLFRIVIQVDVGGSWRKFNELQFDAEPDDAAEVPIIEQLVAACANEHAGGIPGRRYRALMWRKVGVEKERRVATFRSSKPPIRARRRPLRGHFRRAHEERVRRWRDQVERMRREQEEIRLAAQRQQEARHAKMVEHVRTLLDELSVLYGRLLVAKGNIERYVARALFLAKGDEINHLEMSPRLRHDVNMETMERLRWTELLLGGVGVGCT